MVSRLNIEKLCDICWGRTLEERVFTPATDEGTIGFNGKQYSLEWCEEHGKEERNIEETIKLFLTFGKSPNSPPVGGLTRSGKDTGRPSKEPVRYKCEHCGRGFSKKPYYEGHLQTHSPEPDLPFKCEKCDERFGVKQQLAFHMYQKHNIRTDMAKDARNERRRQQREAAKATKEQAEAQPAE